MNAVMTELRNWKDIGKNPTEDYFSNVESIQAAQEKVGKPVFKAALKAFVRDVGVSDETSWDSLTEEDAITEFAGLLHGKSKIAKRYIDAAKKQTATPATPAAQAPAPQPALPEPTAKVLRDRMKEPGVDYAAEPNSIVIQVRGLDTYPVGNGKPITLPFNGDLAQAGATIASGMGRTVQEMGGSFRESLIVVTDANGRTTHYLTYNPAERTTSAATRADIVNLREDTKRRNEAREQDPAYRAAMERMGEGASLPPLKTKAIESPLAPAPIAPAPSPAAAAPATPPEQVAPATKIGEATSAEASAKQEKDQRNMFDEEFPPEGFRSFGGISMDEIFSAASKLYKSGVDFARWAAKMLKKLGTSSLNGVRLVMVTSLNSQSPMFLKIKKSR
jgi:hypothetical protein